MKVKVHVSPQFFGWMFGLGDAVKIESPDEVVEQFREQLGRIAKKYGK